MWGEGSADSSLFLGSEYFAKAFIPVPLSTEQSERVGNGRDDYTMNKENIESSMNITKEAFELGYILYSSG